MIFPSFAFFNRIMLSWLKCDRNIGPSGAAGCDFDSRAPCTLNPTGTLQTRKCATVLASTCSIALHFGVTRQKDVAFTEMRVSSILLLSHFVHDVTPAHVRRASYVKNFPAAVFSRLHWKMLFFSFSLRLEKKKTWAHFQHDVSCLVCSLYRQQLYQRLKQLDVTFPKRHI